MRIVPALTIVGLCLMSVFLRRRLARRDWSPPRLKHLSESEQQFFNAHTRVLILGGGFGGLAAALSLDRRIGDHTDVSVLLIDRDNSSLFTPLLWTVADGRANPNDVVVPIRKFQRGRRFHVLQAEVQGIDLDQREVQTNAGIRPYDYLIVAMGSVTQIPDLPGVRENGGQYTHAAVWAMIAFAALGDGDKAAELFTILNPINHASTRSGLYRYKVEPYVMAGDVYSEPPHAGRGGWTWYTGAAGWLYRAGLESILGIRIAGDQLLIRPCIPRAWRRFDVDCHFGRTVYHITVTNPFGATSGISHAELDHLTILRPPIRITMLDDQAEHTVRVVMG
jgi:hypothetical protein